MTKTLKRLVVSPYEITPVQKLEQIIASTVMMIPGVLDVKTDFLTIPDIISKLKRDEGDNDLDRISIKKAVNRPSYHAVHLILTDRDWKKLKLGTGLYGSSGYDEGQIITYGRWCQDSKYKFSNKYAPPISSFPEASIGTWHETDHAMRRMFKLPSVDTHYYFYGWLKKYTKEEEQLLKPKRWERTPNPLDGWRSLPFHKL